MFGNPDWFREKKIGWGLTPISWQGWIYSAIWAAIITSPFVALLGYRLVPEALMWMAASVGALVWDVRQILRAMRSAVQHEVFIIDDDGNGSSRLVTRNFDMQLRDETSAL